MHSPKEIVHYLMMSQLSAIADAGVYAAIVQVARRCNGSLGISGALVFDGERFCHLIEGPRSSVAGTFRRIESDVRHSGLRVLHKGEGSSGHGLRGWYSGYCGPHDLDSFTALPALGGAIAVDRFLSLVHYCDLAP